MTKFNSGVVEVVEITMLDGTVVLVTVESWAKALGDIGWLQHTSIKDVHGRVYGIGVRNGEMYMSSGVDVRTVNRFAHSIAA